LSKYQLDCQVQRLSTSTIYSQYSFADYAFALYKKERAEREEKEHVHSKGESWLEIKGDTFQP